MKSEYYKKLEYCDNILEISDFFLVNPALILVVKWQNPT